MSKIIRTEPNAVMSKAVEYHGFVYVQGVTARDLGKDVAGQTQEVLQQIDEESWKCTGPTRPGCFRPKYGSRTFGTGAR